MVSEILDQFVTIETERLEDEAAGNDEEFDLPNMQELKDTHLEALRNECLIRMAVLSKMKLSKDCTDEEVMNKFCARFERSVPLQWVDFVLVHGLAKSDSDRPTT